MSLLEDLQKLAETLAPHEIPSSADNQRIVGAIVKTLEHAGTIVADELLPPAEPAVAAAAAAVTPEVESALTGLLGRLEAALAKVEGQP